jgi:hypothetical protein
MGLGLKKNGAAHSMMMPFGSGVHVERVGVLEAGPPVCSFSTGDGREGLILLIRRFWGLL